MSISAAEIKRQFNRVNAAGWLPWFQENAKIVGTSTAHLLAIGSRETNLKNIRGDFRNGRYNGFGVMQVDVGTDPDYAKNWTPDKVEPGIRHGAEILSAKMDQINEGQGKRLTVKGHRFLGKRVDEDDLRRIATAAYNCGLWAYYHFSRGEHVDTTTTGHDYSRDVYERSVEFAELLDSGGIEPGALANEIELQGKYALAKNQKRAGVSDTPDVHVSHGEPMEDQSELIRADYRDNPETKPEEQQAMIDAAAASVAPVVAVTPVESSKPPVPGGGVDDPPKQVTNPWTGRILGTIGGGSGAIAFLKGIWASDRALIALGMVCLVVIVLGLIFKNALNDWLRMKLHSDPSKINVK